MSWKDTSLGPQAEAAINAVLAYRTKSRYTVDGLHSTWIVTVPRNFLPKNLFRARPLRGRADGTGTRGVRPGGRSPGPARQQPGVTGAERKFRGPRSGSDPSYDYGITRICNGTP